LLNLLTKVKSFMKVEKDFLFRCEKEIEFGYASSLKFNLQDA